MNGVNVKNGQRYKGWMVSFSSIRPITGRWRAERFGVGMCAGTSQQLQRMIDLKVQS